MHPSSGGLRPPNTSRCCRAGEDAAFSVTQTRDGLRRMQLTPKSDGIQNEEAHPSGVRQHQWRGDRSKRQRGLHSGSTRRSSVTTADPNQLDNAIARVYAGPLEDFVRHRDSLAKELRVAGNREAAATVKALPKPSRTAWALNLAAGQAENVARLEAAVAATLETQASGGDVRAALGSLRDAVREFADHAARAAERAGQSLQTGVLVNAVLALVGRTDSREALRRGRLGRSSGSRRARLPCGASEFASRTREAAFQHAWRVVRIGSRGAQPGRRSCRRARAFGARPRSPSDCGVEAAARRGSPAGCGGGGHGGSAGIRSRPARSGIIGCSVFMTLNHGS